MRAVTENDATTDYFSGDKDFPVFSRVQTGYGCEQLIKLLMISAVPADRICIMCPTGVSENATFVIDVDAVRFSDLKSDDMGTWKATGTKSVSGFQKEPYVLLLVVIVVVAWITF